MSKLAAELPLNSNVTRKTLKMKTISFKTALALLALASILSGCETGQSSQQSATTTVSGYVSVGGAKTVH